LVSSTTTLLTCGRARTSAKASAMPVRSSNATGACSANDSVRATSVVSSRARSERDLARHQPFAFQRRVGAGERVGVLRFVDVGLPVGAPASSFSARPSDGVQTAPKRGVSQVSPSVP
jgi:hypothetical protein